MISTFIVGKMILDIVVKYYNLLELIISNSNSVFILKFDYPYNSFSVLSKYFLLFFISRLTIR